jgi:hypothetical protein
MRLPLQGGLLPEIVADRRFQPFLSPTSLHDPQPERTVDR